jgi:putative membrane protein insertion efficiency factor
MGARLCIFFVRGYQVTFGQLMGGHCRFHPTCSEYSIAALREHGAVRGLWLTFRRLLRCHPWGGVGFDPVPSRRKEI